MSNPTDARLALRALAVEQMFTDPRILFPPPDPLLADYGLCAYLTAVDEVRDADALRVFYGVVAQSKADPSVYLVAIRGTERFIEWVIDAEFVQVDHPVAGCVEHGFWSVYETMRVLTLDGREQDFLPGLAGVFGPSAQVIVVGHSLGAALATYAALDVARIPGVTCMARIFASPRPGNHDFTQLVDTTVHDCRAYAYEPDLVPRVPFALGYSALGSLVTLPKNAAIRDNPAAAHHCANYSWLIDAATGAPVSQLPAP